MHETDNAAVKELTHPRDQAIEAGSHHLNVRVVADKDSVLHWLPVALNGDPVEVQSSDAVNRILGHLEEFCGRPQEDEPSNRNLTDLLA